MRALNLIFLLTFALAIGVANAQFGGPTEQGQLESADISKSISIYPNPATTDYVVVRLLALNAHQAKLSVFNILGNEIQTEIEVIDDHEVKVRVKEFSAGYYLIAVRDEKTQFKGTYKFLKR